MRHEPTEGLRSNQCAGGQLHHAFFPGTPQPWEKRNPPTISGAHMGPVRRAPVGAARRGAHTSQKEGPWWGRSRLNYFMMFIAIINQNTHERRTFLGIFDFFSSLWALLRLLADRSAHVAALARRERADPDPPSECCLAACAAQRVGHTSQRMAAAALLHISGTPLGCRRERGALLHVGWGRRGAQVRERTSIGSIQEGRAPVARITRRGVRCTSEARELHQGRGRGTAFGR